jgi:hypothetical protein
MIVDGRLREAVEQLEARRRQDEKLCLKACSSDAVDIWFPMLALPETRRYAPVCGCWEARATWPGDRLIWSDEAAEAAYIRRYEVGIADLDDDDREEFVWKLDNEAVEKGWCVPWPWENRIFIDHSGEVIAEGMANQINPIDLVALALFRMEDDDFPDFDAARAWLKDMVAMHEMNSRPATIKAAPALEPGVDPVDLWANSTRPTCLRGFCQPCSRTSREQGAQMGVDPGGLAASALAVCAAAIPDAIRLQVKEHDPHWIEAARLWWRSSATPAPGKARRSPLPFGRLPRSTRGFFGNGGQRWRASRRYPRKSGPGGNRPHKFARCSAIPPPRPRRRSWPSARRVCC